MSLSAWEQQALDSIKDGLAGSDPQLAALLGTFTQLASDEDMPAQENIQAGSRRANRIPRPGRTGLVSPRGGSATPRRRLVHRPTALQWGVLLLWLAITTVLITVALVSSRGGSHGACTVSLATICTPSPPH